MPRTARKKISSGIYHIIVRSISEVDLYKTNSDKDIYLKLIRKYQLLYNFKIYAYCLMTTHGHFIIDCAGNDISMIMKSINQSYVLYYNKKYERHGHLFQDRFKSFLVNDEESLLRLSAYIHNNPKDISKYKTSIEKYKYSSLGAYFNICKDSSEILDTSYILEKFNGTDGYKGYYRYMKLYTNNIEGNISYSYDHSVKKSEYRNERTVISRKFTTIDIVTHVSKYVDVPYHINIKYNHKNTEFRALCVVIMRSLCNFTFKEIGTVLGNLTISSISRLCSKGLYLINNNSKYTSIINDLTSTTVNI